MFQRLCILSYHRVLREPDPLRPFDVDITTFTRQMKLLKKYFHLVPLRTAVDLLSKGEMPSRAACVTFDDGYKDNLDNALPILERYEIPATCYVSTGFLGGDIMFNDKVIEAIRVSQEETIDLPEFGIERLGLRTVDEKRQAIGTILEKLKYRAISERARIAEDIWQEHGVGRIGRLMMTESEVRQLSCRGVEIGAHTVNHPILAELTEEGAKSEIEGSADHLSQLLGEPIEAFAYPNGRFPRDFGMREMRLVETVGLHHATTTNEGLVSRGTDRFALPRIAPARRVGMRFMAKLIKHFRTLEIRPDSAEIGHMSP